MEVFVALLCSGIVIYLTVNGARVACLGRDAAVDREPRQLDIRAEQRLDIPVAHFDFDAAHLDTTGDHRLARSASPCDRRGDAGDLHYNCGGSRSHVGPARELIPRTQFRSDNCLAPVRPWPRLHRSGLHAELLCAAP